MWTTKVLPVVCGALTLAYAAERRVQKNDLPAAVQRAAKRVSQGAPILGFTEETEGGKRRYEVETKINGRTRDILLDAEGNTISVEQEVPLSSLPATVKEGLLAAAGKGTITKVELVTEGGKATYEAAVQGGARKEVTVDDRGRPVH